jgi:hypothetical protein
MTNPHVGITIPKEFLEKVVDPDMAAFGVQAELRLAYHACTSLFSLRDWVFESHKETAWTSQSNQFSMSSKKRFLTDLCSIEGGFAIIADIANASKHMILDSSRRLTDLYGSANVHVQTHGGSGLLGFGAVGGGAIGSVPRSRVFVQIGTHFYDVLEKAQKVHALWTALFAENAW